MAIARGGRLGPSRLLLLPQQRDPLAPVLQRRPRVVVGAQRRGGGRDELNFSTWDRSSGQAGDAAETILDGSMPPRRYVIMNPDARLSAEEKRALVDGLAAMDDNDGHNG